MRSLRCKEGNSVHLQVTLSANKFLFIAFSHRGLYDLYAICHEYRTI